MVSGCGERSLDGAWVGSAMNANFRIGFNLGGLLKNLGVFVVKVSQEDGERIIMVCDQLRVALILAGQGVLADRLIAEFRK
jgi:hypothetical protein